MNCLKGFFVIEIMIFTYIFQLNLVAKGEKVERIKSIKV